MQYKPVLSCNKRIRKLCVCMFVSNVCFVIRFDKNHHVNDFRSSSFACMMFTQRLAVCVAVREKTHDCLDRTFLIVCHDSSLLTTSCLAKQVMIKNTMPTWESHCKKRKLKTSKFLSEKKM